MVHSRGRWAFSGVSLWVCMLVHACLPADPESPGTRPQVSHERYPELAPFADTEDPVLTGSGGDADWLEDLSVDQTATSSPATGAADTVDGTLERPKSGEDSRSGSESLSASSLSETEATSTELPSSASSTSGEGSLSSFSSSSSSSSDV